MSTSHGYSLRGTIPPYKAGRIDNRGIVLHRRWYYTRGIPVRGERARARATRYRETQERFASRLYRDFHPLLLSSRRSAGKRTDETNHPSGADFSVRIPFSLFLGSGLEYSVFFGEASVDRDGG